MSQPKRYNVAINDPWFGNGAYIADEGEYVLHSDYAALAAEKEALVQQSIRDHGDWRSKLNFLEADYKAEIARLRAENERLTKLCQATSPDGFIHIRDIKAAKEGRDAK